MNPNPNLGDLYVRDPDAPCDEFVPGPKGVGWLGEFLVQGNGVCMTDGHYLCGSCIHNNGELHREREAEEANRVEGKRLVERARQLEEQAVATLDADMMAVAKDAWAESARFRGADEELSGPIIRCTMAEIKIREGYRPLRTPSGEIKWVWSLENERK